MAMALFFEYMVHFCSYIRLAPLHMRRSFLWHFCKRHRWLCPTLAVAAYACRQQRLLDCAKPWFAKEVWSSGGMVGESGGGFLGQGEGLCHL